MIQIILLFKAILSLYQTLIVIYVLMSWIPESRTTQLGRIIGELVEPYLSIFRKIIPPIGMIDISPLIAVVVLNLAMQGLFNIL
ncbi:YggT family protein [Turicibacter sp. TJ11]|uniref:YggT family protein n=1 Tax=Turicibacter sp. TJ11 TaxID=2806443 RepID=UPI001F3BDCB7|nr:YggT family protein [Turicibacter sp. TJ11]